MKELNRVLAIICTIMFGILAIFSIVLWAMWDLGARVSDDTVAQATAWAIIFFIGMIVFLIRYKRAD